MTPAVPGGKRLSRRRFITICAAALPGLSLPAGFSSAATPLKRWTGIALGARAEINLAIEDAARAERLFHLVEAELQRLENIFSLYRKDSEISRLNRDGVLPAPSLEFVELLGQSRQVHRLTHGAFDPAVQPLWTYFAEAAADHRPLPLDLINDPGFKAAQARTGFQNIRIEPQEIRFLKEGMALTLNGIAQGYITDRITAFLSRQGCQDLVVDLGEISVQGKAPELEPSRHTGWPVMLRPDPSRPDAQALVHLSGCAVASSARTGTTFDQAGHQSHIIDPGTGLPVQRDLTAVSVIAQSAALADGLSTAALVCGEDELAQALKQVPEARAYCVRKNGASAWLQV